MTIMTRISNLARYEGDPRVLRSGKSSRGTSDQLAVALGWFSLGLGVAELVATKRLTQALGMQGQENLVRAYGVREIMAGMLTLSPEKQAGLWSRQLGDGLDIATLLAALRNNNPQRQNVMIALGLVIGVTVLDVLVARANLNRHDRQQGQKRLYGERSGFPRGVQKARGAARDLMTSGSARLARALPSSTASSHRASSTAARNRAKSRKDTTQAAHLA